MELGVARQGPGQGRLKPPDHPAQEHADLPGEAAAAVELPVHRRAGQAVPQEPQHAGEHVLTVLILEELLQLVVGEGGVLHIDLPHNAHLDFFRRLHRDLCEGAGDVFQVPLHLPQPGPGGGELPAQGLLPMPEEGLGLAGVGLIGADLVAQQEQQVPVGHRHQSPDAHGGGQGEPAVPGQGGKAQGDDGDLQPQLVQGLAQHHAVVGGPAAPAGLELDKGHVGGVMGAAGDGVELLAQGADGGVAHVVVDVFQAGLHHVRAMGAQHLHPVPAGPDDVGQQLHVDGEEVRDEQNMLLFIKNRYRHRAGHGNSSQRAQQPPKRGRRNDSYPVQHNRKPPVRQGFPSRI